MYKTLFQLFRKFFFAPYFSSKRSRDPEELHRMQAERSELDNDLPEFKSEQNFLHQERPELKKEQNFLHAMFTELKKWRKNLKVVLPAMHEPDTKLQKERFVMFQDLPN